MGHIQKLLVPMDGSPSSLTALAEALTLAEDLGGGAEVDVLHVKTADPLDAGSTAAAATGAEAQAEREMEEAIAGAKRRLGDRLSRRTDAGDPIRKILEVAAADHADLIVMGTHGRVGRLHALVGSVAEGVVRNASCPVLTVRQGRGEEESFAERIHGRQSLAEQTRSPRR
jgi:nucleotide-binding universal stress UspA family protein